MLTQKVKGSNAFNQQKVKNIAIEYRLQSIFCNSVTDALEAIILLPLKIKTLF